MQAASAFLSQPNPGKFPALGYGSASAAPGERPIPAPASAVGAASMSPRGSITGAFNGYSDVQRLTEELAASQRKVRCYDDAINQAKLVSTVNIRNHYLFVNCFPFSSNFALLLYDI